ncbi:MAG: helix-hairpin-helix domain-containing protein [Bacteroidota bacterium]
MIFLNSAWQDLCNNYTLPLLLMLGGAWFLGWLLSFLWWSAQRKTMSSELFNAQAELDNTRFRLVGKENELNDLSYAKQKLDEAYAALRSDYHELSAQKKVNPPVITTPPSISTVEPPNTDEEEEEEEEEVIPEHVQEVETRELPDAPSIDEQMPPVPIEEAEEQDGESEDDDPFDGIFEEESEDESISDDATQDNSAHQDLPKEVDMIAELQRDELYFNKVFTSFDQLPEQELKAVKGIGRKMEKMLQENGIFQLQQLEKTPVEALRNMLAMRGEKYEDHDPQSWPDQAGLLLKQNWQELLQFQKIIERGEKDYVEGQPVKVERVLARLMGYDFQFDELQIISGIGPKTERLLKEAGYQNWNHLAKADPNALREVLLAAGGQYQLQNPESWPQQARLVIANDWKALKKYQEKLYGGKV